MTIRTRLILSYIAMIIIPVLLLLLFLLLTVLFYIGDIVRIKNYYGLEFNETKLKAYFNQRSLLHYDLRYSAMFDPDKLLNPIYLSNNEPLLERMRMAIVVEKNKEIVYAAPELKDESLSDILPRYSEELSLKELYDVRGHDTQHYYSDDKSYNLTMYKLNFNDKTEGVLYLFRDMTPIHQISDKFPPVLLAFFLSAFVIPGGLLTYWISQSIIKPLRELQAAAEQIKEGNLDFNLQSMRKDELGQLSRAFEEMRVQLKASIDLRLREEESRKELISNISHDLKTPITAIKGYVEGIIDGVANDPDKLNKYIQTIHTKASDLDVLIDELFLYVKLDLNSVPFHYEAMPLLPFLQDCADEFTFDLEKQGIAMEWDPSGVIGQPIFRADREKLKRVILNIIENSKKFMNKSPAWIRMGVESSLHSVSIAISDNGIGIDKESLPYIFDRFYRADKARTSTRGGSGLGLAIAKQIVAAHGGTIQADSRPGEGTTITITLPVQQP